MKSDPVVTRVVDRSMMTEEGEIERLVALCFINHQQLALALAETFDLQTFAEASLATKSSFCSLCV